MQTDEPSIPALKLRIVEQTMEIIELKSMILQYQRRDLEITKNSLAEEVSRTQEDGTGALLSDPPRSLEDGK